MTTSTPSPVATWRKLFNAAFDALPAERQLELSDAVLQNMLTFRQAVGQGVTDVAGVDDWVEYWHDRTAPYHDLTLREFLGMDTTEYGAYMRGEPVMATWAPAAPAAEKVFSADDFIPMSHWGKDHWSTLAYAETVMTDCGGFQVGVDGRMRSGRRNFRVMTQGCPKPKRAGGGAAAPAVVMEPGHSTKLKDGQCVTGHDDWSCIQDMAAEGLFNCGPDDVEPGVILSLSDKGTKILNALREFKRGGGQYAAFRWPVKE